MQLKVLFVCGSNACRSQMAEGMLRDMAVDGVAVASAGLTSDRVHPRAIQVMSEMGIDISKQRSKSIEQLGKHSFDVVITLCQRAKDACLEPSASCPAGELNSNNALIAGAPLILHWAIADPATASGDDEQITQAFRVARDDIHSRISVFVEQGYVAALRESRQRLERIVDSLQDGVVIHDDNRQIYLFNREAEKITGFKREDVIGSDCHKMFAPGGLCGSQCQFRSGDPGEIRRHEHEVQFFNSQGEQRRLRVVMSTMSMGPERPGQVVVTFKDITEVTELRRDLKEKYSFHNMVGGSHSMQEIFNSIRQVSASDYPVLITGENGTGKELVARAIHNESRRKGGPFVPINCGALPDHILESELFGHVRGAFTGAVRDRKGRFELADRGTLFLDEVGELSHTFQVKLLRVLQEKRFERVGGERSVNVDVRIVSATNRDLRKMITEGSFREDLYYRLCVAPIELPPLRQRSEDIPLLVDQILANIEKETGKGIVRVSNDTFDLLLRHHWPGNVRELVNAMQFASIRCSSQEIEPQHLPPEVRQTQGVIAVHPGSDNGGVVVVGQKRRRKKLTVAMVQQALVETQGNKVKAAKHLGVGRATLYRFLDDHPVN